MNTFFTSDTHFGHKNIAGPKVSNWPSGYRHYTGVPEMNEDLIARWNAKVGPNDLVYHLGDVGYLIKPAALNSILHRLNGKIHLIVGNHEEAVLEYEPNCNRFESIQDVKSVYVNSQKIFMSHYAHRVWNKSHNGVWHLYGHSHGNLENEVWGKSMDVGVDVNNFEPVSFDALKAIMDKRPIKAVDHHGA